MFIKNNFFKNLFSNSKNFKADLQKTKKNFITLKSDIDNFKIPLLECYEKNYIYDFSPRTVKKFYKYKNIIIIGMGGSILGAKSIYSFFKKKIKKNVFFFDNLDTNLQLAFKNVKNLENSCFIIISKSGNTIETLANFGSIFSKTLLRNKLIVITEIKDNALIRIANKYNAEIIEHKDFIGGRYSVMSEVGMFPAALMGINILKFKNLKQLINNKNFVSSLIQDVTNIYILNKRGIRNSVILNYDSTLNDLCYWYQQLVGESLGKKGKGITPLISSCPKDHHSLLQLYIDGPKDKFFTFLNLKNNSNKYKISKYLPLNSLKFLKSKSLKFIINAQSESTKAIFKLKRIPFRQISFKENSEKELGAIITFFVLETILLARLMNLNPFDQPAIEQVKLKTTVFLS